MLKWMKYMRVWGVATYYTCGNMAGECQLVMARFSKAKSTSCIATKYVAKLRNDDNFLHKPGMNLYEPRQADYSNSLVYVPRVIKKTLTYIL